MDSMISTLPNKISKGLSIGKVKSFKMPKLPKMPSMISSHIPKMSVSPMKMKVNTSGYQKSNKKLVMRNAIRGAILK